MMEEVVRILVQQPALRKYRIPFFREWSGRDGVSLKLMYGFPGSELTEQMLEGIEADCVPSRTVGVGPLRFKWQPAQWAGAKKGACHVLVLSWNVQYLSLVPALVRARVNGIKTLLWGHGFSKRESGIRKMLRNAVGRLADGLVFYDHATARRFQAEGWPKAKIHVAPNALDQEQIQVARSRWLSQPDQLSEFQRELQLAERKNIIYIGRIYEENRLDLLIEVLPPIKRRHPDVQLLVIGTINDVALALQERAQRLGVSECVRWLGAIYEEDDIAPLMLSSQLFCYPANIGLSIMHAMGYGVPVVTGDRLASHNPEIHVLQEGVNGRRFKHGDAADLARVVCEMLDAPDHLASMGAHARSTVLEGYTTRDMVDGFIKAVNAAGRR